MDNIAASPDNRYALVIGIGKRDVDNEAMKTTSLDAARVSAELKSRVKISEPKLLVDGDAGKANILSQLDGLIAITGDTPAEMVIIYFSGHGCVVKNTYYIVCRDTNNEDLPGTAIEGSTFSEKLMAIKTDKMLILLDCCHSGGMYNAMVPPAVDYQAADVPFDGKAIQMTLNRVIISASSAKEVSFATYPLSVFTYALVEGLAGQFFSLGDANVDMDTNVTLLNLAMYLRERVTPLTKNQQHPQLNTVPESATTDFLIKNYPKGLPKAPLFEGDFCLTANGGKDIVDTSMAPVEDKEYRQQFTWIVGNNNTIIQNANTINNNFYASLDQNRPFNLYLTKVLTAAIDDKNDDVATFNKNHAADEDWYLNGELLSSAQLNNIKSYANVIGVQLRKLTSIGLFQYTVDIGKSYTAKCLDVAKTIFQLMDFALISELWTKMKPPTNTPVLDAGDFAAIKAFFEFNDTTDGGVKRYITLFRTLTSIYAKMELEMPIKELTELADKMKAGTEFYNSCDKLIEVQGSKDPNIASYQNCLQTEKYLADVMVVTGFLASYKMVSIKSVNYDSVRSTDPRYLHKFVFLGDKSDQTPLTTGLKYQPVAVSSDAILLYRDDYNEDGINLFPFIMDYNSLVSATDDFVNSLNICVYSSIDRQPGKAKDPIGRPISKDTIMLRFPDNDKQQGIANSGWLQSGLIQDFGDYFKTDANRLQFKNDTVFVQFDDAMNTLLKKNP